MTNIKFDTKTVLEVNLADF